VCQVLSQNIDIKCLKSGGQKHPKGPLLGMPEFKIINLNYNSKTNVISTDEVQGETNFHHLYIYR
jgi:hypothetical protein